MIVVDTNVMTHLLVGGESGADAAMLFEQDPEWAAPIILMSELRNVLLGLVRVTKKGVRALIDRGALISDQAKAMSDDAAVILGNRIATVTSPQVFDIALECGLTAYDAEFVALARTLGVPLATLDSAILQGATDVAVSLQSARGLAKGPKAP